MFGVGFSNVHEDLKTDSKQRYLAPDWSARRGHHSHVLSNRLSVHSIRESLNIDH